METLTITKEDDRPLQILAELPVDAEYTDNYQPPYEDEDELLQGIKEVCVTEPVTNPRQVDSVLRELAEIAEKKSDAFIVLEGGCEEPVSLRMNMNVLVKRATISAATIASSALRKVLHIRRDRGQNAKPRSKAVQIVNGEPVTSYMGDAVNEYDENAERNPDPSRMVGAADQARDLETAMTKEFGRHVPAAHEALLLAYEKSFIRADPETGKKYLLSADMPWIGLRTNNPDGEHVKMLAEVENPVGIKLGSDTTPEQIAVLAEKLNPGNKPGKLIFMPRLGLDNIDALPSILDAIKEHAPDSLVMYDIHGSTKTLEDGRKTRVVSEIIEEIRLMIIMCNEAGLRLNGLHLETMDDDSRIECVDEPWQTPAHQGRVDPQLNPRQLKRVLDETAHNFTLVS